MKRFLLFCITLFCLLISCNKQDDAMDKKPDYLVKERSGNKGFTSIITHEQEQDDHHFDQGNRSESIEENSQYDENKEYNSQYEDNFWSYLSSFSGITSNAETPILGNLGTNMKYGSDYACFVCSDSDNNAIYYINYGDDYYIYQLQGDKSTLLVNKKASHIQLWEGNLYFLAYKDDNVQYSDYDYDKSIYKYNLKTKELELIKETAAFSLLVSYEGIFYGSYEKPSGYAYEIYCGNQLEHDSNKLNNNIGRLLFIPYKDYYLLDKQNEVVLRSKNNDSDEITVMPFDGYREKPSIYGNVLYFTHNGKLYTLNLEDASRKIYDLSKADHIIMDASEMLKKSALDGYNKALKTVVIYDYIVHKDEIYIAAGSLFKVDENDEIHLIYSENTDYSIYRLNTSGDRLFAICRDKDNNYKFIELIISDKGLTYKDIIN